MASTNAYRVGRPVRRTPTCDMCKTRHQKCNGARPRCNNCELRAINCAYSNLRAQAGDQTIRSPESAYLTPSESRALGEGFTNPLHRDETSSQARLSDAEYQRLHSQIFDDIVRRLNLEGIHNDRRGGAGPTHSRPCGASLPSLYREVSSILKGQVMSDNGHVSSQTNSPITAAGQSNEPALEQHLEHVRKVLRDYLPTQDVSQRLLDMFFEYQNSIFYVCNKTEAQEQLVLMYTASAQISISWYCQMFLFFAVSAQFDDLEDVDGESFYSIAQKYIDDAIDENPQDTLWVMRAMLLLCFYQQPTKWTSTWIYLDAAIRGAHKFQLDLGHNLPKELSDKEYQEWRQLWLTIISFDRWVSIFLGRLPRIKESISRDPIFKGLHFESSPESCAIQNHITGLAIISGYILRDVYFSQQFSLGLLQQRKTELQTWITNLPEHLQQQLELDTSLDPPKCQTEAAFNLLFMYPGAWMLLTRTSLLRAVKTRTLAINMAGPIASAIASDAGVCIDYAFRLINRATTELSISLPPKRSFMPLFFLVNAAHIMILGAVWNRKQSGNGYGTLMSVDQSRELSAIESAIRVLDFCGQRNPFARKYASLIKDLRHQLDKGLPNTAVSGAYPSSIATHGNFNNFTPYHSSLPGSFQPLTDSGSTESHVVQNTGGTAGQSGTSTSSLTSEDVRLGYDPSAGSLNTGIDSLSEQFGIFYPTNDMSPYDTMLQNPGNLNFLDDMLQ